MSSPTPTPPLSTDRPATVQASSAPPTIGRRVWKGFGGTPWWRLVLGGLIVLIAVAMLTVPFDAIRLQQRLKSPAEKQAFKLAVQRQVLDRARFGALGFRTLLNDPAAAKEINDAIGDIERELATPKHDVVIKNVTELKALIDTQKDEIRKTARAIDQFVAKPRASVSVNAGATATANTADADSEANVELLANKVERLQESVQQLQEMQSRKSDFDEASATGEPDKTITVSLFGTRAQAVVNVSDRSDATLAATPIEAGTREYINTTIDRDANKMIVGSISLLALLTLFLLMLIARGFAGRAARGEQRAVIAESRERSESYARQLAEARLMVMRAQVEPHFLFNTLAHVQALQEIDPPQAGVMMERLISYLRAAMPTMRETTSTLGREIEVVRAYLDLLKIRMGDRLRYVINVPAELSQIALPPTMIATLVENAIKHGLEPKKEGGTIAINARILPGVNGASDQLEMLVADDGLGLGGAQTQGTGIGLANTRERLKMLYGSTGSLLVEPNAPSGVRALLTLPTVVPEVMEAMTDDEQLASGVSPFTLQTVGLLALFVGWLGVHRFYVGRMRSGASQTTLGTLSILSGGVPVFLVPLIMWVILDVVWVVTREFRDGQGRRIARLNSEDRRAYNGGALPHASGRARVGDVSRRSRAIALILTLLLGLAGAHRFYVGRPATALAMLLSVGGLGIWWLIDIVLVASGQLKDNEGKWVSEWE
jgi:TM2 domain-containing membrane protein YozV